LSCGFKSRQVKRVTQLNQAKDFDIAIIGGGPTGSALAMLLARLVPHSLGGSVGGSMGASATGSAPHSEQVARIGLFQSGGATRYGAGVQADTRVLAINQGSRVLLDDLGVWPADAASIHTIHVSQKGRLGRTLITDKDFKVDALGHVVRYANLHNLMLDAAIRAGVTVCNDEAQIAGNDADGVAIHHGEFISRARLVVRADGMNHTQEPDAYTQVALLGSVRVTQPKRGWAYERFTRQGPFAVLPHPNDNGTQSIVWCCSSERAAELVELPLKALALEMDEAFGDRLGHFIVDSPLKAYPLYKSLDPSPINGRTVSIGNAAQTLHPVAGQGLNLGLRDAATLAHCLRDWIAQPHRDPARSLGIYANLRKNDRQITASMTHLMSSVFTTGLAVVEHAAGLALLTLDTCPTLRAPLARHLMQGLRG
jgi:2-octaprenyl-6-methoxyphenol hydroxylase